MNDQAQTNRFRLVAAGAVPNDINAAAFSGAPAPSGLAAEEQHAYDQLAFF